VRNSINKSLLGFILFACTIILSLLLPATKTILTDFFHTDFLISSVSSAYPVFENSSGIPLPTVYDVLDYAVPSIRSNKVMAKKYAAEWDMSIRAKRVSPSSDIEITENMRIQTIDMSSGGITFNNASGYSIDKDAMLARPLEFSAEKDKPRVLIVHTHTSEAYSDSPGARSRNDKENVVRIGKEIADYLNNNGIYTIHDTTKNDEPDYNGSYKNALSTIQKNLLKHPSIEVVLDVHRDYTVRDAGTENELHLKPTQTQNGKDAAQIMFVIGTDAMDLHHPDWQHNLSFAVKLQDTMNTLHPKLCRPINVRIERFNQHMTKGSMIIEVGSSTNTLKEAIRSGRYIAEAVAEVLNKN
jgi:stage II sporulation protein P